MEQYEVIVSLTFKKEFHKLPNDLKETVHKHLGRLKGQLIGLPLKHDLAGFWSIHFYQNRYRIIYQKDDNTLKILAMHVGKRTDSYYKKLSEEARKLKSQLGQGDSLTLPDLGK